MLLRDEILTEALGQDRAGLFTLDRAISPQQGIIAKGSIKQYSS